MVLTWNRDSTVQRDKKPPVSGNLHALTSRWNARGEHRDHSWIRNQGPIGVVSGSTVRAKNVVRDISQMLKNIVGGELHQYTNLLNESRNEAFSRMLEDAKARGANGVVNLRFATSAVSPGAAELFCYGTAVLVE